MNRRLMVCSLVAATLILPALAYAQNNQGDEGRCFRSGIPNGTYAFEASGYISGTPICSAAQLTFFADGKITMLRSSSFGGTIVKQLKLTGHLHGQWRW